MLVKNKKPAPGLAIIEKVAKLLDSKFRIPGTKFRYGLDPVLGFLPVIGDLTSFAISAVLILYMAKHGASRKVVILMIGNIVLDTIVGSIPLIGNIFDFTFKANNRNLRLLKEHYEEGKHQGSGKSIIYSVLIMLLFTLMFVIYIIYLIGKLIINLLDFF